MDSESLLFCRYALKDAAVILLGSLCLITSSIQLLCKILSAEHFQYLLLLFVKCFILLFFKLKDPHLRFSNFLFLIIFVLDCLFMVRGLVHGLKLWVLGV
jgi:hypothetical protein